MEPKNRKLRQEVRIMNRSKEKHSKSSAYREVKEEYKNGDRKNPWPDRNILDRH